jgi:hypothetical protein
MGSWKIARPRAKHAMDLVRYEAEVQVVEDRDPEHDVDRPVGKRQLVRRRGEELRTTRAAVHRHTAARDAQQVLGDIESPDVRTPIREQHAVRAGAAAEVDDAPPVDIAQQVITVLERVRTV